MAYPRKPAAPSNTIKLSLDPDTFDRLKAQAAVAKDSMERTAYRLLQGALAGPPATRAGAAPEGSPGLDLGSLAAFSRREPQA